MCQIIQNNYAFNKTFSPSSSLSLCLSFSYTHKHTHTTTQIMASEM